MVRNPKIIVYGQDKTLLDTRAWVLQTAGFEVSTATELNEIESLSTTCTVELLILCHTLSHAQLSSAISLCRSDKSNIGQLLLISGPTTPITETPYPTVNPLSGPNAFIKSVRDLVTP